MKALKRNFALAFSLALLVGFSAQAQNLTGAKEVVDTKEFATVRIYDKMYNLLEEVVLMDKMSYEEAQNLIEGADMVEGVKNAKYYTIVSPKTFTTVRVFDKKGKVLEEIIFKDQLSKEEVKDMVETLDMLQNKKASYYTINDSNEKIAK